MGCDALYDARLAISGKDIALFDLATWKNGLAFKKIDFSDSGIPVIKIAELNNGIGSSTSFTRGVYSSDVKLQRGDFLFSWSGNPETSIDIFRFELEEGWLNQHIFKTTPNSSLVTWDYFFYLMKWLKPVFKSIASNKQTTGLGHITISDLKKIKVTVPAKDFQDKVAAILTAIDNKISLNAKLNGYLAEQCEAVVELETGQLDTLSSLCSLATKKVDCRESDISTYVSTESLLPGKMGRRKASSLPQTGKVTAYQTGDTLISNIRPYFKKIWYADCAGTCSGDVLVFRTKHPEQAEYLYSCIRNDRFFDYVMKGSKGTKMPRGDKKQMLTYKIVSNPAAQTIDFLQTALRQISITSKENNRLVSLRDALLPKLMSGEIDVSKIDLTQLNSHLA